MYQELFGIQEDLFRTIASRKRLELIQLLNGRELTVSEISVMLGIRQANVSQHLSELRKAKIVATQRNGTSIQYRLSDPKIIEICSIAKDFLLENHAFTREVTDALHSKNDIFPVVTDPVCGMRLSQTYANDKITHNNQDYYFCASGCHRLFIEDPAKYI